MLPDFMHWLIPTQTKALDYQGTAKLLMAEFSDLQETLDAYGEPASEIGGAYKAPGDILEAVAKFLVSKGYKRTKNKLALGNVLVELGADDHETFVYISDDN